MVTNILTNGASAFKIRRPLITSNGFTADLAPEIKEQLQELDNLLGLRVFSGKELSKPGTEETTLEEAILENEHENASLNLISELHKPLIAKKTTKDRFDNAGILNDLYNNSEKQSNQFLTIGDCIDQTNMLASLKYDFQNQCSLNWNYYEYNTKAVLSFKNVSDYLIAYAFFVRGISEVNGLINFVRSHKEGVNNVVKYAVVSAARNFIKSESLNIAEAEVENTKVTYNNDQHPLIQKITSSQLSISSASFKVSLQKVIDDYIFSGEQMDIIEKAGIGYIDEEIKPLLVKYLKNYKKIYNISPKNAKYFIPLFISQIKGTSMVADDTVADPVQSDKDFDVEFFEDSASAVQISVSNVKCAAQLFYCMVLGDELDVFGVVNYFTHKFLIRGGIEIQDHRLREILQQYVFSNKFTDVDSGRLLDRTRPAERQMFYKQVFNYGNARTTQDVIVNDEFSTLWKTLMFESAKYIERAQESPNPVNYVSRQTVMQAVEDLQYNLSTHCSGMANVITPLIYDELNFVIKNILMHPEVTRQVVPVSGTWWRVVETLYSAMKSSRPKSTVLYNKAKLGQTILKSIAEYNPSSFEDDASFSGFISNVDAFITTQSILQESLPHEIRLEKKKQQEEEDEEHPSSAYKRPEHEQQPAKAGNDEWDF
jgi:hypothetical protein